MTTESDKLSEKLSGKRSLARAALDALLATAGADPARIRGYEPLPGGTYNTIYRAGLDDGTALLLKLPPERGTPAMSYEHGLLHGEAVFYAAARDVGVPVPELVHADPDGDFLVMTECPGTTWDQLTPAEQGRLRRDLGGLVGRLHQVTGPRFGYPALPPPDGGRGGWRGAFLAMLDTVLADARRFDAWLPEPPERVAALVGAAAPALDEVREPVLVHFDLWPGNILLHADRISALIDGERMFWGDPLAELTSLNLFGGSDDDAELLAGYRSAGGRADFDEAARLRMALYNCYLYLIMLVEVYPRGYPAEQVARHRKLAGPALTAALDVIATTTGT
ncbi:phosphotransferase [Streptomyces sp. B6B3]|uniref:phosphotransferase family protein n=1 Tax=Streptomyces sp. B6B3 TaxID=3153570 RepID=UPI00325CCB91